MAHPLIEKTIADRVKFGLTQALPNNPDNEATYQRWSKQYNIPVETLRAKDPEIEQDIKMREIDPDNLAREFTHTAKFLSNPDRASLTHDDVDGLTWLEKSLQFPSKAASAVESGYYSAVSSVYGANQFVAEAASKVLPDFITTPAIDLVRGMRQDVTGLADKTLPTANDIIEKGVYAGLSSLPQMGLSLMSGGTAGALTSMFAATGGQAFGQARDNNLSFGEATQYGVEQGTFEVLGEMFGVNRLFGDLAANSGIAKVIARQLIPDAIGEQTTTILQDASTWLHLNPEKSFNQYLAERPEAAGTTLVASLVGSAAVGTALPVADRLLRKNNIAAGGAVEQAENLANVQQAAQAAKLSQRDPQALKEFAQQASTVDTVYINPEAYLQSADRDKLNELLPEAAARLEHAQVTGSELAIPASDYIAAMSQGLGLDLTEHVRLEGQDMSAFEAKAYLQNNGAELSTEINAIVENKVAVHDFELSSNNVHDSILNEIKATGRYTDSTATTNATLVSSFYRTLADDLGVTPEQAYNDFKIPVVNAATTGKTLDGTKGAFMPDTLTIGLFEGADLSTFAHESGHAFLEIMSRIDHPVINQRFEDTLKWFGVTREEFNKMDVESKRPHHERFAQGFEAYLFEGKAPSPELQTTFRKFRSWLTNVYKSLVQRFGSLDAGLNTKIDKDIRRVFDRTLATDAEIEAANEHAGLFRLFDLAELSPEDLQNYLQGDAAANQEAKEIMNRIGIRDMKWLSNTKNRVLKSIQKDAAVLRADIREEIANNVNNSPIYKVWNSIKSGQTMKLSVKAVEALGIDSTKLIDNKLASGAGVDPRILMGAFPEYTNVLQFVNDLNGAIPPDTLIDELTDARMLADNAEFATPATIELQAIAAVHNEARGKFVTNEFNTLQRMLGKPAVLVEAAKQFAADAINGLKIKNLKPDVYVRAEKKAAVETIKAHKKADTKKAAEWSRARVLNFWTAKTALDAKTEIDKGIKYFKKVLKSDKIDADYRSQIEGLLSKYNFTHTPGKVKSYHNWVKEQLNAGMVPVDATALLSVANRALLASDLLAEDANGMPILSDEVDIALRVASLLEGQSQIDYKEMTVEQFLGLLDTVKNIEHFGKTKNKLLKANQKADVMATAEGINNNTLDIANNKNLKEKENRFSSNKKKALKMKLRSGFLNFIKAPTLIHEIDGDYNGPLYNAVLKPANENANAEMIELAQAHDKMREILKPIQGDLSTSSIAFPSIGRELNLSDRIVVALYRGNESNLSRLMEGEQWTIQQVEEITNTLTEAELNVVQQIHDYFEQFAPRANEIHRRINGKDINMIPATPWRTTSKDGKTITMKGGYVPVAFDPFANNRSASLTAQTEASAQLQRARNASVVNASFTKDRVKMVKKRPIKLDLNTVISGIQNTIHYIHWQEWALDTNRILKYVDEPIRKYYGAEVMGELNDWAADAAAGTQAPKNSAEKLIVGLASNVSRAGLAFNLVSAAKQVTGLSNSMAEVGKRYIAAEFLQYIQNPKARSKRAMDKSQLMHKRQDSSLQVLAETQKVLHDQSKIGEFLDAWGYKMLLFMQGQVDNITWNAGYNRAIAEGLNEVDAIQLADRFLINSQGSGHAIDLASAERSKGAIRVLMAFSSYMNTVLNSNYRTVTSNKTAVRKVEDLILINALPVMMGIVISEALTIGDSGDNDEEYYIKRFFMDLFGQMFGGIAGIREVTGVAGAIMGEGYTAYHGPTGMRLANDIITLGQQIGQGEIDQAFVKATVNLAGTATGIPSAQINRTIKGATALEQNKTDNPAALVFGYSGKLNK